jgi:hypothetical protein
MIFISKKMFLAQKNLIEFACEIKLGKIRLKALRRIFNEFEFKEKKKKS